MAGDRCSRANPVAQMEENMTWLIVAAVWIAFMVSITVILSIVLRESSGEHNRAFREWDGTDER